MEGSSSSSALQAILRREIQVPTPKAEEKVSKPDEKEYEAFSFGRVGIRPQLMLAFRKSNGEVRVRPYAILQGIDTDNEHAWFALDFPGLRVQIRGRNLSVLFRYLWLHRVVEVTEADTSSNFLADDAMCVIESLSFLEARIGAAVVSEVD
jgi:hypothetical protein